MELMMDEEKIYRLPNPQNESEWINCLVLSYKTFKGVDFENRTWDRANWSRSAKAAKLLLEICGSLRAADACMVEFGTRFDKEELNWTLETICRHASDWIRKKRGVNASSGSRARFFKAIAEQRARKEIGSGLRPVTSGEILASLGDPEGSRTSTNGKDDHGT
jgi:hypothetical protein